MTREELLARYEAGERDFSGISLRGLDFSDCDLSGINLSNADLESTDWEGANLSRANLSGAFLASCTKLQDCAFSEANLTDACVQRAIFGNEPCLVKYNLTGVDLSQASIDLLGGIDNPRIEGAILCDTTLPDGGN